MSTSQAATPAVDTPLFTHDCERCTFLGRHLGEQVADLYVHTDGPMPTVIARYSDEGSDYNSGLAFVGKIDDLTEAHRRAVERGLLPQ